MVRHRRRLFAPRRLVSALALVLAAGGAFGSAGCHAPAAGAEAPEALGPPLAAVPVSEAAFAETTHRLLREGAASRERSALLAGVVERQLAHAARLFAENEDVRGTNAVVGAIYLVRIGEVRGDMFGADSAAALRGAIERFSARGDEGRALALMATLIDLLPEGTPERAEITEHLGALRAWSREVRTGGDMARLSADERAAIGRSLLQPSEEALTEAAAAIGAWIQRAVDYNAAYQETRKLPPRDEIAEAYKALQAGAETMAALYLRYGRAEDALEAIENTAARNVTNPAFFTRLRSAAVDDAAEDWRLLARDFARLTFASGEPMVDQALLEAALWGIAVEAYRRDPTSHAIVHLLADRLIALEMPEVAPLVLRDALGPKPPVAMLSAALGTVGRALAAQRSGPAAAATARRIFAASRSLLELADDAGFAGRVEPSSADLRRLMAGIELEHGDARAAAELLRRSLEAAPTARGHTLLAALERQLGRPEVALTHARRAAELPHRDPLDAAEARLTEHEIARDAAMGSRASGALDAALGAVLAGRGGDPAREVRAELLLARILDGYGQRDRARRALDRALALADGHRTALAAAVMEAVGRALVHQDVDAARAALQRGIKAGLDSQHLVYAALWVMILERQLGEAADGKVDRVLVEAAGGRGWVASLARWGRRTIDDAELLRLAKSQVQQTEASFYLAMAARVAGASEGADPLVAVAKSPLVDLFEVRIARDLLAPALALDLPRRYEQALSALPGHLEP